MVSHRIFLLRLRKRFKAARLQQPLFLMRYILWFFTMVIGVFKCPVFAHSCHLNC
ncbi:hypothetical protein PMPD1_2782 [Paramixta manurensis]|uniref:Uncharacterized protein n=1 Tax=Paramixta manurensis TaxID=2740817 RepID=A0A6M8UD90_9GAMM|nr:hypothetical protein PMPD1_2782 [Erwiniaceae bacterium PD-1]